jgi:hypothetical protein
MPLLNESVNGDEAYAPAAGIKLLCGDSLFVGVP